MAKVKEAARISRGTRPSRTARLEARISREQKALLERAAAYEGRTLTDFVIGALAAAAMTIVQEHESIRLNQSQSEHFVRKLLAPPPPNAELRRAVRQHRQLVASR